MLGKLIKHDLKNLFRQMLPFYIITLGSTLVLFACYYLPASNIRHIIVDYLTQAIMITVICSTFINSIIRAWLRYKTNFYGDESYLTHTLPVTRGQLFASKSISSMLMILASCFVCGSSFLIININSGITERIPLAIKSAAEIMNVNPVLLTIAFLSLIVFEIAAFLFAGFFGITLGHCFENGKGSKSFCFGALIYILGQAFFVAFFICVSKLFWPEVMAIFSNEVIDPTILMIIILISLAGYGIYLVIEYFLTHLILKRCVNIE